MNIALFEPDELHPASLQLLRQHGHQLLDATTSAHDFPSCEAIFIRTYTQATSELLSHFTSLKHIIKAGAGTDNIDLEYCKNHHIQVSHSPGANARSVAELAVGLSIFLMRNVPAQVESLANNHWRQRQLLGSEIGGKTVGILGCGAVGKLITKQLAGFDVKNVLGYDPFLTQEQLAAVGITKAELSELLTQADVVVLCIPLTADTRNLITTTELQQMKPSSYLINVSRGGIVNEQDLCSALTQGTIAGAALDVFENEPSGINQELLQCKSLIATPHIGGFTVEGDRAICLVAVENFIELTTG